MPNICRYLFFLGLGILISQFFTIEPSEGTNGSIIQIHVHGDRIYLLEAHSRRIVDKFHYNAYGAAATKTPHTSGHAF